MNQIGAENYNIGAFGQKLMVASKSINKIPDEYLTYAKNARIYDAGIGPRKGSQLFLSSKIGTKNRGVFVMNDKLYQITNSRIYEITKDGEQKEIVELGFDCDIHTKVYNSGKINSVALLCSNSNPIYAFDGKNAIKSDVRMAEIYFSGQSAEPIVGMEVYGKVSKASGCFKDFDINSKRLIVWMYSKNDFIPGEDIQIWTDEEEYDEESDTYIHTGRKNFVTNITQINVNSLEGKLYEIWQRYAFYCRDNMVYMTAPIMYGNATTLLGFNHIKSIQYNFESEIVGMKAAMSGLYVFTKEKIHFFNGSQEIKDEKLTFVSSLIGETGELLDNRLVVAVGDKIFYITKGLSINTVNYVEGTTYPGIGDLSNKAILGIKGILETIDTNQENPFSYYNEVDNTINFFLRSKESKFNDIVIVYDIVNDTWGIDTNRNYSHLVKYDNVLYGCSDIDSSIFIDSAGETDSGDNIPFLIRTQNYCMGDNKQKLFSGFNISGVINELSVFNVKAYIDNEIVFEGNVNGRDFYKEVIIPISEIGIYGDIGGGAIGAGTTGGNNSYTLRNFPFDMKADAGSIHLTGIRIMIEISNASNFSDYIIDTLGINFMRTDYLNIGNKF